MNENMARATINMLVVVLLLVAIAWFGWLARDFPWLKSSADWATGQQNVNSPAQVFSYIISPLGTFVAIVALVVNLRSASQTLALSKRSEIATRFQKSAELLADPRQSTNMAGLALLDQLWKEAPETYAVPVMRILLVFVTETDEAAKLALPYGAGATFTPAWPKSDWSSCEAIALVSRIARRSLHKHTDFVDRDGRVIVPGPYICYQAFRRDRLNDMSLVDALVNDVSFEECEFRNSEIFATIGPNLVEFIRCDLANAKFRLGNEHPGPPVSTTGQVNVLFKDCRNTGTAKVNGQPLDEWIGAGRPPYRPV